jgi:hypothetical protein
LFQNFFYSIAGNFIGQATASAYLEVNSGLAHSGNGRFLFILLMLSSLWSRFATR